MVVPQRETGVERPRVKWVFFDLDGTLINSTPVLRETFFAALARYGVPGSEAMFHQCDGQPIREIARLLQGWCNSNESTEFMAESYRAALLETYVAKAVPLPGADTALRALSEHGTKLGLVTAAETLIAVPLLRRLGWSTRFDIVIFGDEVRQSKPAPDPYLRAIRLASCSVHEALAVEDSVNGVRSAAAAGLFVVAVGGEEAQLKLQHAGASAVVTSLAQLFVA